MRLALGIFIFIFLLMSTQCTQSRKEIPLPKYKVKKLSSGLEVYYFEDHKLPTFHII
ncbi:MAG: hypothetical protein HYS98_05175 [Deltaproteobacteria bacterium]|nr:hypothetical protein [Deltaproteobacteria bacterium]